MDHSERRRDDFSYKGTALFFLLLALAVLLFLFVLKPDWTIRSDGYNYYSYLRSLSFDRDIHFLNEITYFEEKFRVTGKSFYDEPTVTNHYPNPFAIGMSIFEIPWFLAAQAALASLDLPDSPLRGFSCIHAAFLNIGNIVYGFGGLILTFLFLRHFTSDAVARLATFTILFATPLIYFMVYEAIWAHLLAFLWVSAYVLFWYTHRNNHSMKKYAALGVLLGVNFLIRWQNSLLVIFLIPDIFTLLKHARAEALKRLALLGGAFIIISAPQLLVWKILYGAYIVKPPSNSAFIHLFNPRILQFLFSPLYGMFFWTPLFLFSFFGLFAFVKKHRQFAVPLLLFLALQIYINSAISDWWGGGGGGGSFGARRMLDYSLFYALGIGYLIEGARPLKKYLLSALFTAFIAINLLLMIQSARDMIGRPNPYNNGHGRAVPNLRLFIQNTKQLFFHAVKKEHAGESTPRNQQKDSCILF